MLLMLYQITQVNALKTLLKNIGQLKVKALLYIIPYLGSGRSCKGQHRHFRMKFPQISNMQVRRPEIITPLRDAMRLVNRNKVYIHIFDTLAHQVGY